jgi:hypothetical protein
MTKMCSSESHAPACVLNASFGLAMMDGMVVVNSHGRSEQPSIAVQAATFEQAKCDMELALAQHS